MKLKRELALICIIAMFGVLVAVTDNIMAAERWVYIGQLADMTGPAAPQLIPISRGTDIYFQDLNKKGGIKGVKVGEEWVDTKYRLADALSGYERMKDKIVAVTLAMSHAALALKEKFAEDKIPANFTSQSPVPYWPPGWIYGIGPSFNDSLMLAVDFFLANWKEKRPMRVALVFSDDTFGRGLFEGGTQYLKARGVEVVAEEPVKMNATDATSQLLRVKEANPDYILCNFTAATQAVVLKDRYRLGIKIPVSTSHGSYAEEFLKMAGPEACEGVITPRPWGLPNEGTPGVKLADKLIREYVPEWTEKPGGVYAGIATGMVIAEAIRLAIEGVGADKLSGATLKEFGLDRIKNFDTRGLSPKITYTPTDHRGGTSARLIKIVGGKLVVLEDWTETPVCKPPEKK